MEYVANDAPWSTEDQAWLDKQPATFQPIALRHGRELYEVVMAAGVTSHALRVLNRHTRGNHACEQAISALISMTNVLATKAILGAGADMLKFAECKGDVERLAALADSGARQPDERVSPGGIILNS